VIGRRSGQAVVEWIAVLGACTILAAVGIRAITIEADTMAAFETAIGEIDIRAPEPVVAHGPPPATRYAALPRGEGGDIVALAERLLALGIVEQPPGSNTGPQIRVFTDGNAEPWCADFVSWVLKETGRPFTGGASGGWRLAWTPDIRAWFSVRGRYRTRTVAQPEPGDVIWFGRGHVGFVRRVQGERLETIEGNAGDAVRLRVYEGWRSNPGIDGFGRP
jgi:hypothetical protein